MKYILQKDWEKNGRIFKEGKTLDITQELAQWLDANGYGKKKSKKPKKVKEDGDINSSRD